MKVTTRRAKITVSADGLGIVSQVGALLLTQTMTVARLPTRPTRGQSYQAPSAEMRIYIPAEEMSVTKDYHSWAGPLL
jgi:hypothetical protein